MRLTILVLMICFPIAGLAQQGQLTIGEVPEPGDTLREFLFFDYSMEIVRLSDLAGSPVVLLFWMPGDANSTTALNDLERIAAMDNFSEVHAVAVNIGGKTGEALMQISRAGYDHLLFLDGDPPFLAEHYGVTGVPTIFVADAEGKLVRAFIGYDNSTARKVRSTLESLSR